MSIAAGHSATLQICKNCNKIQGHYVTQQFYQHNINGVLGYFKSPIRQKQNIHKKIASVCVKTLAIYTY